MESDQKIKVSIIIPVFNTAKYLHRLIESLLNQTLDDIELIFINDGSTDESQSILENYALLKSRFTVINRENEGVSCARNFGLSIAKGEYIGFVDSDDFVDLNMFSILYSKAKQTDSDVVCCGYFYFWENKKKQMCDVEEMTISNEVAISYLLDNEVIGMSACCKLFRRSILFNTKFPENIKINEDRLFVFRSFTNAKNVTIIGDPLYYYCVNKVSSSHDSFKSSPLDGLRVSREMYEIINIEYPRIISNSYADVVKTSFLILISMYKSNSHLSFSDEFIEAVNVIKNSNLRQVRVHISRKIYFQLLMIKYYEPGYRLIKRILFKKEHEI